MKGIVDPDCFYVFSPRFSVNSTPVGGAFFLDLLGFLPMIKRILFSLLSIEGKLALSFHMKSAALEMLCD